MAKTTGASIPGVRKRESIFQISRHTRIESTVTELVYGDTPFSPLAQGVLLAG